MTVFGQASGLPTGVANSLNGVNVYEKVTDWTNEVIDDLFGLSGSLFADLASLMTICAAIYVALMGFSLLSGRISMSPQDVMVRISKLVLVVVLFGGYTQVAGAFYELFFVVPEALAASVGSTVNSGVGVDTFTLNTIIAAVDGTPISGQRGDLNSIVEEHSAVVGVLTTLYIEYNNPVGSSDMLMWFVGMSPVIAASAVLVVARFVMTILLFVLPIIAIAALFGRGYGVLGTWVKVMLTLGLTIILTYIAFSVLSVVMIGAIGSTIVESGIAAVITGAVTGSTDVTLFTLYDLAPLGILSLVVFIIISQIPNIAGSIVGAAGINNQQVSGFTNIAALRAAG